MTGVFVACGKYGCGVRSSPTQGANRLKKTVALLSKMISSGLGGRDIFPVPRALKVRKYPAPPHHHGVSAVAQFGRVFGIFKSQALHDLKSG
jgi:hypothetical protein